MRAAIFELKRVSNPLWSYYLKGGDISKSSKYKNSV
jgi:hypothetical protein